MTQEIERKFLVTGNGWRTIAEPGISCRQGYISTGGASATVRVRLLGRQGFLTIKGPTKSISRSEMEYEIPAADAEYLLEHLCDGRIVSKTRYILMYKGLRWEIDEFSGDNQGLIMAEIELDREDQPFEKPEWVEREVSFDPRYFNSALARNPFGKW
ncbi:MAG: CYTH domain-containing protein [Kiritimatiellales bacterium]|nr:CYTH domain-containing protein [Kiritimatiellales bacterium]